ncbi:MAG: tetratricopeptide repeat protein [Hydrogenophaga sp.]|uniref:tetratricopeptide repeat protein n=1 Tax=Hydrogenophaga sp. TaxID=1904254 RepID=UPI0025C4D83D|nr:tetratricopeptide repeat protein [Hydrogenophaga sp.]MBU7575650.1 tetratricopeptide repeat protein [Hydrogenophaga sp.]
MPSAPNQLHDAHALVIEGNLQSRSILVAQLRDLGVGTVVQCSRLTEGRRKLEMASFDVVICEQRFERESGSGQDLLDDLRRNQLLPFHTVFVMLTAEASYASVAEAAESALDAYLLKPHTASRLAHSIVQARVRKQSLQDIFSAIDAQDFERAANLCQIRFESRQSYWLYAARIGAELMLRGGRVDEAQTLYQAVIEAKTLPWARLGVARAQLENGQPAKAVTTLESLIRDDDAYADAYDVMGRAQFELGNFQSALTTYEMATRLTPSSISRLLKHGMLAYYTGERSEGVELLDRATRLGLDSKMYDAQALLLLAFARLDNNDARGLQRTVDQLTRLRDRSHAPARPHRLLAMAESLLALQQQNTTRAVDDVRRLSDSVLTPDFDFESACNLLALMGRLAMRSLPMQDAEGAVDRLALRFGTSRAMTELLACAAGGDTPHAERVRAAHGQVLRISQDAMALSLKGDPQGTVQQLLEAGERTGNAKLIESAHQVLQRYSERMDSYPALQERVEALRALYRTTAPITRLGEHTSSGQTPPGGVSLSGGYKPPSPESLTGTTAQPAA